MNAKKIGLLLLGIGLALSALTGCDTDAGRKLAPMTGIKTSWSSWVADHPGSKLMR